MDEASVPFFLFTKARSVDRVWLRKHVHVGGSPYRVGSNQPTNRPDVLDIFCAHRERPFETSNTHEFCAWFNSVKGVMTELHTMRKWR